MFTGFATENTPAIQIWDYFRGPASGTSRISLTDDCAPIQLYRTGTLANLLVYLPTCPVEGKIIKIVNQRWGANAQNIEIFSSDQNITTRMYRVGPGASIDLIYSKNLATQGTASGNYVGGWTILNYSGGNAASQNSIALLDFSSASGANAIAIGNNSSASSTASMALGSNGNATSVYGSVLGGFSNTANSTAATIVGGYVGNGRIIDGYTVFPASTAPISFNTGTTQSSLLVLAVETTGATATVLRSSTSAAGTSNQLILPNNSAYVFQGTVIANRTGGGDTSGWKFEGTIKRGANAASTTLVAAVTPTVISQDAGASAWVVAVTADTTNGGLAVTVTGAAATTIRWVCRLQSTEVTF